MRRMLPAMVLASAAVATPSAASALAPMCAERAPATEPEARAPEAAPGLGPVTPSLEPLHVEGPRSQPELPAEDLPWCASPDDPRCAPMQQDSTPTRVSLQAPVPALSPQLPSPADDGRDRRFSAHVGLSARAGHGRPIEHPPRLPRR